MPLSAGRVLAENTVECPYHGWRFRTDGVCSTIPSLVEGQDMDPAKIRVRAYPAREQDGLIWVYMAAEGQEDAAPAASRPRCRSPNAKPRWVESQTFHCAIDHAVIGLMDPAHAPYVHGRWWWRVKPKVKAKGLRPAAQRLRDDAPPAHQAGLQDAGRRRDDRDHLRAALDPLREHPGTLFGKRIDVVGLTVCTPIDAETTR